MKYTNPLLYHCVKFLMWTLFGFIVSRSAIGIYHDARTEHADIDKKAAKKVSIWIGIAIAVFQWWLEGMETAPSL